MKKDKYQILINKENKFNLKTQFKLVNTKSLYNPNSLVEIKTFKNWKRLKKKALKKGFDIEIESAYRTIEYQEKIYKETELKKGSTYAKNHVALPGHSEHHSGLAIDICLKRNDDYLCDYDLLDTNFLDFLEEYSYKYGFIIRYPKGKEHITGFSYEPWHIRYVGKIAKKIKRKDLTLEEHKKIK